MVSWKVWSSYCVISYNMTLTFKVIWGHWRSEIHLFLPNFITAISSLPRKIDTFSMAHWKFWSSYCIIDYNMSLTFKVIWGHWRSKIHLFLPNFITSISSVLRKIDISSMAHWKIWGWYCIIGYNMSLPFKVIWGH